MSAALQPTESGDFSVTSAPLLAAAFLLESRCRAVNDAFMMCRAAKGDPEACAKHAQSVLTCAADTFKMVATSPCQELFGRFWRCLDVNNQNFIYCRDEEFSLVDCTRAHLGITKQLWRAQRPEEGLKDENERPEVDSWRYKTHVWSNKNSYPKE